MTPRVIRCLYIVLWDTISKGWVHLMSPMMASELLDLTSKNSESSERCLFPRLLA